VRTIRLVVACAAACALALPAAANASVAGYRFKVVKASHSSSASEEHGSFNDYNGVTSETWSLRGRSADVPNAGDFNFASGGLITLNVRGVYKDEVHTQFGQPGGDPSESNCAITAATGDQDFPAVAPDQVWVAFQQKKRRSPVTVAWTFPMASLDNPYFGSGCSHPDTDFPDDHFFVNTVPAKRLGKKKLTLVNKGAPGGQYGNYTWRTAVTLKRVKTYR
jgi:hypothetical protein